MTLVRPENAILTVGAAWKRRSRRDADFFDAQELETPARFRTVNAIIIADEILWSFFERKRFSKLLSDPRRVRLVGVKK